MKKFGLLLSISVLSLLCAGPVTSRVVAQSVGTSATITLYSPNKPRGERLNSCAIFQSQSRRTASPCDIRYGSLYAGEDHDWFDTLGDKNRSVIWDLGALNWTDQFKVPVVAPLPELKPGEQRTVTVDTSGADGADGKDGEPGRDGADADGVVRPSVRVTNPLPGPPRPPKRDGKPKIDPVFIKAIPGHLYVIHVVDEVSDFYALFRVDALERGDKCTISWKVIPNPEVQLALSK